MRARAERMFFSVVKFSDLARSYPASFAGDALVHADFDSAFKEQLSDEADGICRQIIAYPEKGSSGDLIAAGSIASLKLECDPLRGQDLLVAKPTGDGYTLVDASDALHENHVFVFESSSDAYDASQCLDEIRRGDPLVVPSERAIAIAGTWPFAITNTSENSEFHEVADAQVFCATLSGAECAGVMRACSLAKSLGYELAKWAEEIGQHGRPVNASVRHEAFVEVVKQLKKSGASLEDFANFEDFAKWNASTHGLSDKDLLMPFGVMPSAINEEQKEIFETLRKPMTFSQVMKCYESLLTEEYMSTCFIIVSPSTVAAIIDGEVVGIPVLPDGTVDKENYFTFDAADFSDGAWNGMTKEETRLNAYAPIAKAYSCENIHYVMSYETKRYGPKM